MTFGRIILVCYLLTLGCSGSSDLLDAGGGAEDNPAMVSAALANATFNGLGIASGNDREPPHDWVFELPTEQRQLIMIEDAVQGIVKLYEDPYYQIENASKEPVSEEEAEAAAEKEAKERDIAYDRSKSFLAAMAFSAPHTSKKIRRIAARELIHALKRVEDQSYHEYVETFLNSNLLSCVTFEDCLQVNESLAFIVEAAPAEIGKGSVVFKMSLSHDVLENPFFKSILDYKMQSLQALALVYEKSKILAIERMGMQPKISESDYQELLATVEKLVSNDIFQRISLNEQSLLQRFLLDSVGVRYSGPDLSDTEGDLAKEAFDSLSAWQQLRTKKNISGVIEGLMRNGSSNKSILLYLERLRAGSPEPLLARIKTMTDREDLYSSDMDPLTVLMMLVRFGPYEYKLPTRQDWFAAVEALAPKMDEEKTPFVSLPHLVLQASMVLKEHKAFVRDFVGRVKMLAFNDQTGSYTLEEKEKWLAKKFPDFHSLFHQQFLVDKAQLEIMPLRKAQEQPKGTSLLEDIAEEIEARSYEALTPFVELACYGYFLPHYVKPELRSVTDKESFLAYLSAKPDLQTKIESPFITGKIYNLEKTCGYKPQAMKMRLIKFLGHERSQELNKKAWIMEGVVPVFQLFWTLQTSMIVGKVLSGPTHAASKYVGQRLARKFTGKVFTTNILRTVYGATLMRWAVYRTARTAVPHVLGAAAGSIGFLVVQRAGMMAFGKVVGKEMADFGYWTKEHLESSEKFFGNFISNYGEEFAMGLGIFFFAPIVQNVFQKAGGFLAGIKSPRTLHQLQVTRQLTQKQELAITGAALLGDTLVFTSIPYIDDAFRRQFVDGYEPGEIHFAHELGHAFTFALVFRAGGNWEFYKARQQRVRDITRDAAWQPPRMALVAKDHYKSLGIEKTATQREIMQAYLKRSQETHPDRGGSIEEFLPVQTAFEHLKDPVKRREYDESIGAMLEMNLKDRAQAAVNKEIRSRSLLGDTRSAIIYWRDKIRGKKRDNLPAVIDGQAPRATDKYEKQGLLPAPENGRIN